MTGTHKDNDVDRSDSADREEIKDREERVAHVLDRALTLSSELKTTVHELSEMLRSSVEEGGNDHSG